jgi:hypothetical protein
MPQMANMTLNNYAASPVTYTVLSINSGMAIWADTSQGTPGGFRTVSEELRRPVDPSKGVTRVLFKIARPVVNATTGLVDYTSRFNGDIIVPVGATLAERQELYAMGKNFLAHANALAAIKDLEGQF